MTVRRRAGARRGRAAVTRYRSDGPEVAAIYFLRVLDDLERLEVAIDGLPGCDPLIARTAGAAVNHAWHALVGERPKLR